MQIPAHEDADLVAALSHLPLEIRRSVKARKMTLRTQPGSRNILLLTPEATNKSEILAFATRNTDWIVRHAGKQQSFVTFAHGSKIPVDGIERQIIHVPHERGIPYFSGNGPDSFLFVPGDEAFIQRRTTEFLKSIATDRLTEKCLRYAEKLGVRPSRISIKDTTTRWGSCSSSRALSFSWRLILAPPGVLDYVAAHETAHLIEMNHSPRFWKLVRSIHPVMDQAKSWLAAHGESLHRYGRSE